jgi:Tol biopolymer transport system component
VVACDNRADAPARQAAKLATSGRALAFARARTGDTARHDLALTGADGGSITVLSGVSREGTVVPEGGARPAWAPNGRRIAFAGARPANRSRSDIYVADADDGHAVRVTKVGNAHSPLWSPDGRHLVFMRLRPAGDRTRGALWTIDADGSGQRRLTSAVDGRIELADSFSPDGRRLLITRMTLITRCATPRQGGCFSIESALYEAKPDASGQQRLRRHASAGAFAPGGERIAFASDRDRNGTLNYGEREHVANELYVMRADGSHAQRLTRTRALNETAPSWSADGARIAFQQGRAIDNAEGTRILEVNPDGTCRRSVLADPRLDTWYSSPAWRPGKLGRVGRLSC